MLLAGVLYSTSSCIFFYFAIPRIFKKAWDWHLSYRGICPAWTINHRCVMDSWINEIGRSSNRCTPSSMLKWWFDNMSAKTLGHLWYWWCSKALGTLLITVTELTPDGSNKELDTLQAFLIQDQFCWTEMWTDVYVCMWTISRTVPERIKPLDFFQNWFRIASALNRCNIGSGLVRTS